eukprot:973712-Prorocentrum_minimum.AAC.1
MLPAGRGGGQAQPLALSLLAQRRVRHRRREEDRVQLRKLLRSFVLCIQSQSLNRNIPHPPTNRSPSIGIYLAHLPIAVPQ